MLAARAKAAETTVRSKGEENDWRQSSVASAQRLAYKRWEKASRRKGFRDILLRRHGKRKGRRKERIWPITGRSASRYKQMHFAERAPSLQCDQPKLNPLEVRRTMNRGRGLDPRANHDTGTKPGAGGREDGGAGRCSRASSGVGKLRVSGDPSISCRNAHRSQVDAGLGIAMKWCEVSQTLLIIPPPARGVLSIAFLQRCPRLPSQSLSSYAGIAGQPLRSFVRICFFLPAQLKLGK